MLKAIRCQVGRRVVVGLEADVMTHEVGMVLMVALLLRL